MGGPAANLPLGLLDAFGIKSGAYPRDLLEQMCPTVDVLPVMAQSNCTEELVATVAGLALGLNTFGGSAISVPQGQTWLVLSCSVTAQAAAADQAEVKAVLIRAGAVQIHYLRSGELSGKVAIGATQMSSVIPGPFWAASGDQFGAQVQSLTGAAVAGQLKVMFLRCRR